MKTLIGLEIHTQLKTRTKMFCGCSNVDAAKPNTYVCPICLGMPGSLPSINEKAVEMAVRTGLAFNCTIAKFSKFDRKNYFYPDLPKGYQISQYDKPICEKGHLKIQTKNGAKTIRLIRIHLEEDAAKATHPGKADYSLIDFNRAGTPLIESVTEPDLSSPEEAKVFVQTFRRILRYLKISDADMEKGQLRVDANVNVVAEDGRKTPIVEIKNMNSTRAIEAALRFEVERHTQALKEHTEGEMIKETRGWVNASGETIPQRSKEESSDYRYFPEPDLPPLKPERAWVEKLARTIPELPEKRAQRFVNEYSLSNDLAVQLANDVDYAEYYEQVISELVAWLDQANEKLDAKAQAKMMKLAANWILVELTKHLNKAKMQLRDVRITPENFAEFIKMVHRGDINSSAAQRVLARMFLEGNDPSIIVDEENLAQVSDTGELDKAVEKVIKANPKPVEDVKKGKTQALQFLMGMVMKETKGKANPKIVQDLLKNKLS